MTSLDTGSRADIARSQFTQAFDREATGRDLSNRFLQIGVENGLTAKGFYEVAESAFEAWGRAKGPLGAPRMAEVGNAFKAALRSMGGDKAAVTPGPLFHEIMSGVARTDGGLIGLQAREARFGEGLAWRVYEMPYKDAHFGLMMGDVTQAPAKAIVSPGSGFEVAMGAAEGAIYEAGGRDSFELALTRAGQKYGKPLGSLEAVAFDSTGKLPAAGIDVVVATNIWPKGDRVSVESVAQVVANACAAAHTAGADSLAVPAIGLGFSGALNPEQSFEGVARGFKRYMDSTSSSMVRRCDIVFYALPTGEALSGLDAITASAPKVFR